MRNVEAAFRKFQRSCFNILRNSYSEKFRKIHSKTPVLDRVQHRCFPVNIAKAPLVAASGDGASP